MPALYMGNFRFGLSTFNDPTCVHCYPVAMSDKKISEFAQRLSAEGEKQTQTFYAATVILLRDSDDGIETLMLKKNSKIAFGGMWVFPGGRIDDEDGQSDDPIETKARHAAVREAEEEVNLKVSLNDMHWFSHWTPPELGNRRFITWFYVAPAPEGEVTIDDGEIKESEWLSPAAALAKQAAGDIELAPPTHVTLHYLAEYQSVAAALAAVEGRDPPHYATHISALDDDLVALWEGDAGYEAGDATIEGARHRLQMKKGGWIFEDSGSPFKA